MFGSKPRIKPNAVTEYARQLDAVIAKAMQAGVVSSVIINEMESQIAAAERRDALNWRHGSTAPMVHAANADWASKELERLAREQQ
jgi:hypothetical protein